MRQRKNLVWGAVVLVVFLFSLGSGQSTQRAREKPARDQINTLLRTVGDERYEAHDVVDVSSLLGDMKYYDLPLEDPYGTLKDCFVFTTRLRPGFGSVTDKEIVGSSRNMVGVFKDGAIIWLSDSTITESRGRLYTTRDINNDGNVEIVTQWSGDRTDKDHAQLWIHRWDGVRGWQINGTTNDWINTSVISGLEYGFVLFDAEGDGILEIRNLEESDGSLTWSWSGSLYGSWPNTPHLPVTTWLPANRIDVVVRCSVIRTTEALRFNYSVASKPTSKQRVSEFYVQAFTDSVQRLMPAEWQPEPQYLLKLKGWGHDPFNHRGHIWPGRFRDGFGLVTKALPKIVLFIARGYNPLPDSRLMTDQEYLRGSERDFLENSVRGITIGPANPPSPFVPMNFLDTLSSYTTQSRSLGWITSQAVADRYLGYFTSAKTQLQQNNAAGARSALQSVLRDVNVDSSSTITSEAYALLRHNTEYLLSKLPVEQQITIDDLIAQKHQAYAKSWIGDEHFVKELDNGLENAKKHLAKGDSVNCAKELTKFQEKVQKEYEKTADDQKKKKPRDKRFVTEEGYRLLTSTVQAIIDRLPRKKK